MAFLRQRNSKTSSVSSGADTCGSAGMGDLDPYAASGDDGEHRRAAAVPHMLCWSCAMCFSAAPSAEKFHGSMNLASNTAPVCRTRPSSVAHIHWWRGWRTLRCICGAPSLALTVSHRVHPPPAAVARGGRFGDKNQIIGTQSQDFLFSRS